ncbi:basic proline-rich protein-like [Colius striatus]|uniref:basic proline-rich protein-like n=1 Tax=Colius striatus TaxID=57412 RepID=UPI002B1CE5EE|nr:basic proline-rich protein-like [Colius striatus]
MGREVKFELTKTRGAPPDGLFKSASATVVFPAPPVLSGKPLPCLTAFTPPGTPQPGCPARSARPRPGPGEEARLGPRGRPTAGTPFLFGLLPPYPLKAQRRLGQGARGGKMAPARDAGCTCCPRAGPPDGSRLHRTDSERDRAPQEERPWPPARAPEARGGPETASSENGCSARPTARPLLPSHGPSGTTPRGGLADARPARPLHPFPSPPRFTLARKAPPTSPAFLSVGQARCQSRRPRYASPLLRPPQALTRGRGGVEG